MSDEEGSPRTDQYSSDAGEEDESNELELEDEVDQDQDQELELLEGAEESEEDEDGESESEESDEDEDDEGDQDAEGDEDDEGELEAALGGMETMEQLDENDDAEMQEVKAPPPEVPVPVARPATPAQIRRSLFVTKPPFPKSWTIEPICALPHPVATHCLAASTCMSYLLTGSEDGFIRCYDFFAGVNGKTYLTAPQRHHCGIGEGTMKAGILKTWWENYSPVAPQQPHDGDDKVLSPVHSMTLQGDALWGLSGTSTGYINLFTVRHDPGRIAHVFNAHKGPVSGLVLQSDELGAFSAGWDGEAKARFPQSPLCILVSNRLPPHDI
ncbi:Transcription factor spt8 [Tulasnella sp. 419]|nr:Transcription factor spt8 [Tulasnella sp. 419]